MFRRWLIRGLALTLLTLCVVAWVGSYWLMVCAGHWGEREVLIQVEWGRIGLSCSNADRPSNWGVIHYPAASNVWLLSDTRVRFHWLGFTLRYDFRGFGGTVPMWFSTLLGFLLFCLVWRKTRAKPAGGAFPVELVAQSGVKQA